MTTAGGGAMNIPGAILFLCMSGIYQNWRIGRLEAKIKEFETERKEPKHD